MNEVAFKMSLKDYDEAVIKTYKKRNNLSKYQSKAFKKHNGACKVFTKGEIQAYEARLNN